ncbi:MAG: ABC transporter [Halobacteriovoraceae bacterium]|nr:ABC transporter [Halobacteriovoraceae bacterium]|tara:strand:- start:24545 stop:25483 length:939 start_codon:yes stop_codon:yes gene_type:complete
MNAIEVDGITKVIGERKILNQVSFKVQKSRIHGFLGPNGAGKTTTMRILCGLLRPTEGEVYFNNTPLSKFDSKLYHKIGFLIEEPPLYGDMRVVDYLKYVARLRRVSDKDLASHLDYCIKALDLAEVKQRSIENLSRGFKQRVGIAQAIIHMPEIVFLDEPSLGLDPRSISEIRQLISNLRENHTVILSSHLLHEMSLVCDDISIISRGRILESGALDNLRSSLEAASSFIVSALRENTEFERALKEDPNISKFSRMEHQNHIDYHITPTVNDEYRPAIVKKAVECDLEILGLERKSFSLEDYFLKVTENHD